MYRLHDVLNFTKICSCSLDILRVQSGFIIGDGNNAAVNINLVNFNTKIRNAFQLQFTLQINSVNSQYYQYWKYGVP